MVEVYEFSSTAGGNNVVGSIFLENQFPSTVNDNARSLMAAMRRQWNKAAWFALGDLDGPATFTVLSGTQFRVEGITLSSQYHVGRRVRAIGNTTGTIVGTISAVTTPNGNTDVTVAWDSGSLATETILIELSIIPANSSSIPALIGHDFSIGGNLAVTGTSALTGNVSASGTLAVTGAATFASTITATGDIVGANGPFALLGLSKLTVNSGDITMPSGTKRMKIEVWGSGGGGSSSPDTFGSNTAVGSNGTTFTVSNSQFTIQCAGGQRGANQNGAQDQKLTTSSNSVTGVTRRQIVPGLGSPGGSGAHFGTHGNPGDYIIAFIDNPTIADISVSGGSQGQGGVNPGEASGGDGGKAHALIEFWGN